MSSLAVSSNQRKTGHLAVFLALLIASCSSGATGPAKPQELDSKSAAELTRIEKELIADQPLLPSDFESLSKIESTFPDAERVQAVYKAALIKREDWEKLADYLDRLPASKLSSVDIANLCKAHLNLGRFEKAIETAKPLADAAPQNLEINAILANAYFSSARNDEAAAILDRLWPVILSQKRVNEMTLRGLIYSRQDKQREAVEVLTKVVEISPQNTAALNALSRSYHLLGDAAKADEYRKRTNDAQAATVAIAASRLSFVGLAYEVQDNWANKRYESVITSAENAMKYAEEKDKPVLYQYIAESHKMLGRPDKAQAALSEIERLKK